MTTETRLSEKQADPQKSIQFGSLMRKLRQNARLSQLDLAELVETSDAYIRKLELGYRPPTLSMCIKLAEKLALVGDDRTTFFEMAFWGRVGDDKEFCKHFLMPHRTEWVPTCRASWVEPELMRSDGCEFQDHTELSQILRCVYQFQWTIGFPQIELSLDECKWLCDAMAIRVRDDRFLIRSMRIRPTILQAIVAVQPQYAPEDIAGDIKGLMYRLLVGEFVHFEKFPNLWSRETDVCSLEYERFKYQ